jgi:membrane-bound ClpP family serine protease
MTPLIIVLLILTGIVLFVVEFLIIPGITVAGVGGVIFLGAGIYYGYVEYGTPTGHYILMASLTVALVSVVFMLRSNTWKKTMLETNNEAHIPDVADLNVAVGDKGISISRLMPMGKVKVNNNAIEARAQTGFIDQKTEIEIVSIEKTYIIVKPLKK